MNDSNYRDSNAFEKGVAIGNLIRRFARSSTNKFKAYWLTAAEYQELVKYVKYIKKIPVEQNVYLIEYCKVRIEVRL